jgi:hypothetical protein
MVLAAMLSYTAACGTAGSDEPDGGGSGDGEGEAESDDDGAEAGMPGDRCATEPLAEAMGCTGANQHPQCDAELDVVLDLEAAALYRFAGRFTRGDASIYRGAVSASGHLEGRPDVEVHDEHTVASLAAENSAEADASPWETGHDVLTIHWPSADHKLAMRQAFGVPHETVVTLPQVRDSTHGVFGTCSSCLAALGSVPEQLTIDLIALGANIDDDLVRVEVDGVLERAEPSTIAFADLYALRYYFLLEPPGPWAEFVPVGENLVLARGGETREPVAAPPGNEGDDCAIATEYTVDWFIDAACPARHGLANPTVVARSMCCRAPEHGVDEVCVPAAE